MWAVLPEDFVLSCMLEDGSSVFCLLNSSRSVLLSYTSCTNFLSLCSPEGEGSYPLSPVHIPDEEFEVSSNHRDDDATDGSSSIGLPDDHQPGVLGLQEHNEMPS